MSAKLARLISVAKGERPADLILANARLLAKRDVPIHIRLVIVPGVNDSMDDLKARMEFITELATVKQIDLLPYHRYGVGKYARLALDYPLGDLPEHSDEQIEELRSHIAAYGIPITIGG